MLARATAHADASAVVLVPERATGTAPKAALEARASEALRQVLAAQPEGSVLSRSALTERLAAHGYSEPGYAPTAEVEALARQADELLRAVAFGYDDETVVRGEVLLDTHARQLHRLMDSDAIATAVADVCLYVVRALTHRGDHDRARLRARECWQLVPDLTPSAEVHPPEVRTLVAAAQRDVAGRLQLELGTLPDTCTLRVQGRPITPMPRELALPPGQYAVRLDCAQRGFTHRVDVAANATTTLAIDVRFEQGLALTPHGLRYDVPGESAEARRTHLLQLARMLGLSTLWTATLLRTRAAGADVAVLPAGSEPGMPSLELARHRVTDTQLTRIAEQHLSLEPERTLQARVQSAWAALACAPSCQRPDAREASDALAITTTAIGGAAVLTSWALFARYAALDGELSERTLEDDDYTTTLQSRDRYGTAAWISSGVGSLALASAAALWAPEHDGVPWWAWASGAAGVAATTVGTIVWLDHGTLQQAECGDDSTQCLRKRSRVPLGPMLVTQGAALASLPITYALRSLGGPAQNMELRAMPSQLTLEYGGSF